MSLSKNFGIDPTKEAEGFTVELPANEDGSIPTFVLARMGKSNKRYAKLLDVRIKPHRRAMQLGTMNEDVANEILREVFAETVLKSWSNILASDVTGDKEATGFAPFTKENALSLFEKLPELYDFLAGEAADAANFRESALEDEAKN